MFLPGKFFRHSCRNKTRVHKQTSTKETARSTGSLEIRTVCMTCTHHLKYCLSIYAEWHKRWWHRVQHISVIACQRSMFQECVGQIVWVWDYNSGYRVRIEAPSCLALKFCRPLYSWQNSLIKGFKDYFTENFHEGNLWNKALSETVEQYLTVE